MDDRVDDAADASPSPGTTPDLPEALLGYDQRAEAGVAVAVPASRARAVVGDLSRLPEWLSMHAAWRGGAPGAAVPGVAFTEQVTLMGIPADVAWEVTRADDLCVALSGTGPMELTLGLWFTVAPDGEHARLRIDAGVGGDPVQGPLGVTILNSVQEALAASLGKLAAILEDETDEPAATGDRAATGGAPVRHHASGQLLDPRTPVIVGVGQVAQRHPDLDAMTSPAALAARSLRRAADDSGAPEALLAAADEVMAVASASWTYADLAAAVAEELGVQPTRTLVSARYGGDAGQLLVNSAGQAVADGTASVVLVCGAEVGATLAAAQKAGVQPDWPRQPADRVPDEVLGTDREANNEVETSAGLSVPVYTYALIESALRGVLGETPEQHRRRITDLWASLSTVAAENEHAWMPEAYSSERLATADEGNRMISSPYTKLLCANLQVDLAAGVIVTSVAAAEEAGVPQDRWVFLHAGAAAHDEWFVSERADLAASPAIRAIGAAVLEHAGITVDDVSHVDLYSCFPAAVQIAARELGLPVDDPARPLSVTGGLTFAGGPGNNYGTHAVATLVARLREDPTAYGLSTSLGWFLTKHAIGIYSAQPPGRPYASLQPVLEPGPKRPALQGYVGPGVVEACTVPHARDGEPEAAIFSVLTPEGARVLVRTTEPDAVAIAAQGDPLGCETEVAAVDRLTIADQRRVLLPPPPPMTVLVERRGPVTVITINRPERRNAVDLATAELLERVVDHFEADPGARVAVITGAGGSFCAGMDLKAAAAGQFAITERGGPLGITARPLAKPLIAAVEGHALAGGCELALVADLVVAATDSQFGLPEPKRGLVAAAGGVLRLAQRLPRNVAMEMALTGNPMPASRMAELGLVNRLAEPGRVLDAALALAEEIMANAPLSVQVSKQIIEESPDWSVEEAFGRQSDLSMTAVLSEDAVEGVAAFAEKRTPVWRGR